MRPRHRLLIIVLPLLVASCRGPGPEVERLEAALVEVADMDDLETGDRFRSYRQDPSTTFFGSQRSGFHSQWYRAGDGFTLEDVHREIVQRLEDDGWEQHERSVNSSSTKQWCGEKTGLDDRDYQARTVITEITAGDRPPRVSLQLKTGNLC